MQHKWVSLTIAILIIVTSTVSYAAPWAEPGDRQLRNDIEVLRRHGLISGPTNTWPMPWKQIARHLSKNPDTPLPLYAQQALARVKSKIPSQHKLRRINYKASVKATTQAALIRDFGNPARDDIDTSLSAEKIGGNWAARLQIGYQDGNAGDHLAFDGSYLAFTFGNWALNAGWIDRWWGPGRQNALLLGTNARPMPAIEFMRMEPKAFQSKWLNWIGPWDLRVFVARQEEDRFISHPLILGMRVSFSPLRGLDIGLARSLQICGEGRPCGFKTWGKGLIGFGDIDNTGTLEEPGNQLASIDVAYSLGLFSDIHLKVYSEFTAEDAGEILPVRWAMMYGGSLFGPFGPNGAQWRLTTEYSDTTSKESVFYGPRKTNILYGHHIYKNGYRYKGRTIGHSLDTDTRLISITGTLFAANGWSYGLGYHHADINLDNAGFNIVSVNEEEFHIFEAAVTVLLPLGDIRLELRHQTDSPNTPNRSDGNTALEVNWSKHF